ncbi:MAG TPA: hypothetical protein VJ717_19045 [Gemmatimonadaceae bacterium]|nr:hypothetical protein [Gemmatimonadaceae bacterium]
MSHKNLRVRCWTAAMLVLSASSLGCNDFLAAENPGAVIVDDLEDPRYASLIPNSVVGEFQPMFGNIAWWNAVYADELWNRAVFFEEGLIDQRNVTDVNGTFNVFLYGPLHRTRFMADDGAARLKRLLGDSASRDLRLARTLVYGAYSYTFLGEMMCATPIDGGDPIPPDELFAKAIERYDEAIAVAAAARTAALALNPPDNRTALGADSIRNFALVGKARTQLDLNQQQAALATAQLVAANFEFRAYYSTNSTRENNWFWNRLTASTSGSLANTPFQAMVGDPRIPRIATGARANVPLSPESFSSWSNTVVDADFVQGGFVRIASSLEAQYIIAEVQGPVASTLTFVNARRAVGLQAPVALTGAALMAELRDQRRRDFYLDNHRLGDLRRYKKYYQVDEFPKGAYPGSTTGETYNANADCWPLPLAETSGVK